MEAVLARVNLAAVYLDEKKTAAANKILPAAIAAERQLAPDSRALADGIRDLARLRAEQHRWNEAQSLYREALGIYEARLRPEHPEIGRARSEYTRILKHRAPSGSQPA